MDVYLAIHSNAVGSQRCDDPQLDSVYGTWVLYDPDLGGFNRYLSDLLLESLGGLSPGSNDVVDFWYNRTTFSRLAEAQYEDAIGRLS